MSAVIEYSFLYPYTNGTGRESFKHCTIWASASSDPRKTDSPEWKLTRLEMEDVKKIPPIERAKIERHLKEGKHNREIENQLIRRAHGY